MCLKLYLLFFQAIGAKPNFGSDFQALGGNALMTFGANAEIGIVYMFQYLG